MVWTVNWADKAFKELRKLDRKAQKDILRYLNERLAADADPKRFGKALMGEMFGLWRYRVGNYRIICEFKKDRLVILILAVGHRKEIYD